VRTMKRRMMNPHQQALGFPTSLKLAIRAKCWDCEGGDADAGWQDRVRNCVVERCPLWHVRPYRTKGAARKRLGLQMGLYGTSTNQESKRGERP
jgi:hypothetical protein